MTEAALEQDLKFMDRNSRMIGAFGLDVIAKMVGMKVLIVGCKGVGIEVAKNTVLAGVHTLTLLMWPSQCVSVSLLMWPRPGRGPASPAIMPRHVSVLLFFSSPCLRVRVQAQRRPWRRTPRAVIAPIGGVGS